MLLLDDLTRKMHRISQTCTVSETKLLILVYPLPLPPPSPPRLSFCLSDRPYFSFSRAATGALHQQLPWYCATLYTARNKTRRKRAPPPPNSPNGGSFTVSRTFRPFEARANTDTRVHALARRPQRPRGGGAWNAGSLFLFPSPPLSLLAEISVIKF